MGLCIDSRRRHDCRLSQKHGLLEQEPLFRLGLQFSQKPCSSCGLFGWSLCIDSRLPSTQTGLELLTMCMFGPEFRGKSLHHGCLQYSCCQNWLGSPESPPGPVVVSPWLVARPMPSVQNLANGSFGNLHGPIALWYSRNLHNWPPLPSLCTDLWR